jgi:ribose-phosphate pyrophosphokinase
MISTGGTLVKAAEAVLERGATSVITCATHGIFADNAAKKLVESKISEVVVTNTIPVPESIRDNKIKVLSVASLLADAIRRIGQNRSISELYEEQDRQPSSHDEPASTLFDTESIEPVPEAAVVSS